MRTWEQKLAEQVQRKFDNYRIVRIPLDAALDNMEFVAAGNELIVSNASSKTAAAAVRFARTAKESINLVKGAKIYSVFTSFFITSTAQPGEWLELLAGIDFDVKYEGSSDGESQPAITVTNVSANANTVAAAHICSSAIIKSLSTNTNLVWINFGAAAVEGSCYDLVPGGVIGLPMSNTNRINALFKVANEKLIVIYVY